MPGRRMLKPSPGKEARFAQPRKAEVFQQCVEKVHPRIARASRPPSFFSPVGSHKTIVKGQAMESSVIIYSYLGVGDKFRMHTWIQVKFDGIDLGPLRQKTAFVLSKKT